MAAVHEVRARYESLETWLRQHSPPMYSRLRDPATAEDLAALETALGRPLPADLRAALEIHDGRPNLDSYTLIPAARIKDRYESEMENVGRPSPYQGDGTCHPVMWSKGWIPFAEDGGLNFLCIDLDPDTKGVAGQVIRWERGQGATAATSSLYVDAPQWPSFGDWFGWIVDACLAGRVDIDDEGFITVT